MGNECVEIYVDGACSPNPGVGGIGVVLLYNGHEKELSENIGESTNNIAELTSIKRGLESIKPECRDLPILIYTDSGYCFGLFAKHWNASKNQELVLEIKTLLKKFKKVTFIKVKGHSSNQGNIRADRLAVAARTRGK